MKRKPETVSFYRKRLPHWTVSEGLYFVTIRQKDSIPVDASRRIHEKLRELSNYTETEQLRRKRKILLEMEKWLDRPSDEDFLTKGMVPEILREGIQFRNDSGVWRMITYVIMPSHVHLFFDLKQGTLKTVMSSFKRKMSREIKKSLELTQRNVWHREWFDHWSRSALQDEKIKKYILNNPTKARLVKNWEDWPYGSWSPKA